MEILLATSKSDEDKIEEGIALLVKRENMVRRSLNVGLVMNLVIMHLNVLKERKSLRKSLTLEEIEIEKFCMQ